MRVNDKVDRSNLDPRHDTRSIWLIVWRNGFARVFESEDRDASLLHLEGESRMNQDHGFPW
jgi:hypothetical protein